MSSFLRRFFMQMGAEIAAFQGQMDRALGVILALDGEGHLDLGWIERCPLFVELRERPEWPSIQRHHRERAARVMSEYHAPLT